VDVRPAVQVEADSNYIGRNNGTPEVIFVEAKGSDESFVRNQLFKNAYTLRAHDEYPATLTVVVVQPGEADTFSIIELTIPDDRSHERVEVARQTRYSDSHAALTDWT